MGRYSASGKGLATAANSNILSIRSTATKKAKILELHMYQEASTAWVNPALFLTSVVDTVGTAVAGQSDDGDTTATCIVSTIPTGGTLVATASRRASLPATLGSGIMWIWDPSKPLIVPLGLSAMLRNDGVIGPAITWVLVWDE